MPKAKLVLHHDDPPCAERLDKDGSCPTCRFIPDMQSTALLLYCPACDVPLKKGLKCPRCGQTFKSPDA